MRCARTFPSSTPHWSKESGAAAVTFPGDSRVVGISSTLPKARAQRSGALRQNASFCLLRASHYAKACGSKEQNLFSSYPGFREPAIAICARRLRSTRGYHLSCLRHSHPGFPAVILGYHQPPQQQHKPALAGDPGCAARSEVVSTGRVFGTERAISQSHNLAFELVLKWACELATNLHRQQG